MSCSHKPLRCIRVDLCVPAVHSVMENADFTEPQLDCLDVVLLKSLCKYRLFYFHCSEIHNHDPKDFDLNI